MCPDALWLAFSPLSRTIIHSSSLALCLGTPLEFLLDELGVRELVIAGIAADNCVLFSASDAYLRRYKLWVPRDFVASVDDADRLSSRLT